MFPLFKRARRDALRELPTPEAWRAIVDRNIPYARLLDSRDRRELEGLVQIFLAEKRFEGCGGLSVTEEMRVTIAAQACLLLLHRETDVYPELDTILVYPHPYRAPEARRVGPLVMESQSSRLGESWTRGVVVLAWDHVNAATHPAQEGHNLVLHEFAHQLDAEDGSMDGAPPLGGRARYAAWARVLGEEYAELAARLHDGKTTDVDPYGATNPAEFFAVVTEMFFEESAEMASAHPALYAELATFFRQDPAALRSRAAGYPNTSVTRLKLKTSAPAPEADLARKRALDRSSRVGSTAEGREVRDHRERQQQQNQPRDEGHRLAKTQQSGRTVIPSLAGALHQHAAMSATVPTNILVPHDFSETAEHALALAIELAAKLSARMTLIHVYEIVSYGYPDGVTMGVDVVSGLRKAAQVALDGLAARTRRPGLEVQALLREGRAWLEINAGAKQVGAELIVMGTHGRHGLAHALLGSVTEKIVRSAPCPVLTVRWPR